MLLQFCFYSCISPNIIVKLLLIEHYVLLENNNQTFAQRNNTRLLILGMNQGNIPLVQIHILAADRPQFKGADARTQKHADNDPGTVFVELIRLGAGQQFPDLVLGINFLEMLLIGHV